MAFLTMTLHQGGAARMYQLSPAAPPALLGSFSGDRRFSRFGGVLHLSDLDGDGLGTPFPRRFPRPGGWGSASLTADPCWPQPQGSPSTRRAVGAAAAAPRKTQWLRPCCCAKQSCTFLKNTFFINIFY